MTTDGDRHPFDLLVFDTLWEADGIFFEVFGRRARLSVYGEASGLEDWQREAFDAFWSRQRELKPAVEQAILAYYLSIADDYRDQFGAEFQHLVPAISSPEELHKVVTPEAVHIGDLDPKGREVDLLFDCSWDDSHGLAVRIIQGQVAEVGPQDICL
jgi:hypothetical protein